MSKKRKEKTEFQRRVSMLAKIDNELRNQQLEHKKAPKVKKEKRDEEQI